MRNREGTLMEMSIQREGNEEKLTKSEIPERERERTRD